MVREQRQFSHRLQRWRCKRSPVPFCAGCGLQNDLCSLLRTRDAGDMRRARSNPRRKRLRQIKISSRRPSLAPTSVRPTMPAPSTQRGAHGNGRPGSHRVDTSSARRSITEDLSTHTSRPSPPIQHHASSSQDLSPCRGYSRHTTAPSRPIS